MTAPVLALTPGDPVGIGPEITAAVLHEHAGDDSVHGIAVADASVMRRAVTAVQEYVDLPLQIDSSSPAAIEAGVRYYNGVPLVNSVNGEEEVMARDADGGGATGARGADGGERRRGRAAQILSGCV